MKSIKMKKSGFTLIELLAVIVIIGIIALISTPVVLNIIDSTRKETFKNSVLSVFKATELYETKNDFEKISNDGINIKDQLLPLENGSFTSGKIIRNNNNKIEIVNVTDGTYCAKGTKDDIIVIKGSCDEFDETAPVNTKITISNITTNSFRVVVNSIDDESGIKNYSYSIDGINFITTTSNNYTFNNLSMNKKYMVYVRVTNNNGITTETVTEEINTKELNEPTYSVDSSGWQQQKIVTINFPEREQGFVYSYSIDGGNTWETLENETTANVTFTTNGNIIARIYDGTNYKTASTYTVSGIDTTAPSASVELSNKTTNTITVKATGTDSESGITKYEFSIDNGTYVNNGTNDTYTFTSVTEGNHIVRVRVTNGSGITTESITLTASPNEITEPIYGIDKTGWQQQKIVTIAYPERQIGFVYSYSIDGGNTWTTVSSGTTANVTFTSNGNVIARVYDGTNYKTASSYTVNQIDTTVPSATVALSSKTTNKITVIATGIDNESGITNYEFKINSGSYVSNGTNASYTFNNVTMAIHGIKVRVTNGSGLTTESEELVVSPNDITVPTYSIDKSGWQQSKTVTITYPARQTGFVYQYSTNGGSNWTDVTSGTTANVNFTTNGSVIARIYDGTNYKTASSYTVNQIDRTLPTHTNWWWGSANSSGASLYIQASDTESGIDRILCPTATATGSYNNWHYFVAEWDQGANAYRCDIITSPFNHYGQTYITHLHMYDNAGNGGYYNQTSIDIPSLIYSDTTGASVPEIADGMIPIRWDGSTWVKADITQEWYNYANKQWANVVLVTESSRSTYQNAQAGTAINKNDALAYFVWIPRYKYKLFNANFELVPVQTIEVVFESKTTPKSTGSTNGTYLTHPAFTFGTQELSGIWVGKFETTKRYKDTYFIEFTPTIEPYKNSYRQISISEMLTTSQNFKSSTYGLTNGDPHVMKNMEWGAVAYLTQSVYGKNSEVWVNNSVDYITGCAGNNASDSATEYSSCNNRYDSTNGMQASTTGNITGIYDMSGGSGEYVMGAQYKYDNSTIELRLSGFAQATIDSPSMSKYIDKYNYGTTQVDQTAYNRSKLGDATGEVRKWNNDSAYITYPDYPWFLRGGDKGTLNSGNPSAGIFAFNNGFGSAQGFISFRVVYAN